MHQYKSTTTKDTEDAKNTKEKTKSRIKIPPKTMQTLAILSVIITFVVMVAIVICEMQSSNIF